MGGLVDNDIACLGHEATLDHEQMSMGYVDGPCLGHWHFSTEMVWKCLDPPKMGSIFLCDSRRRLQLSPCTCAELVIEAGARPVPAGSGAIRSVSVFKCTSRQQDRRVAHKDKRNQWCIT